MFWCLISLWCGAGVLSRSNLLSTARSHMIGFFPTRKYFFSWGRHGNLIRFPWDSHGIPMRRKNILMRVSWGLSWEFVQDRKQISWESHEILMGLKIYLNKNNNEDLEFSHETPMRMSWDSHETLMRLSWDSHKTLGSISWDLSWECHESFMRKICFSWSRRFRRPSWEN